MHFAQFHGAPAYAAGLLVALVLACWLTPRAWWRRPTARGLLILGGGAWCVGSMLLWATQAPATAAAATSVPRAAVHDAGIPSDARAFRVHRDLNLRAQAGVNAPRLAIVPAGTQLTATGQRDGDWWQVRAPAGDGAVATGWVSSLWLRRDGE